MGHAQTAIKNFLLTISNTEQQFYGDIKLQLSIHPEEPTEYTISRVLAKARHPSDNLVLGPGWYEPRKPTYYIPSLSDESYQLWIHVGEVEKRLFQKLSRIASDTVIELYFYDTSQLDHFCHLMRGLKENWLQSIHAYLLSESFFISFQEEQLPRRNQWELTFADHEVYLLLKHPSSVDDLQLVGSIKPIDIWKEYQESIAANG